MLLRKRIMQEFERGKGGTFALSAKTCKKKYLPTKKYENIDAIFEAYGSLPDVNTFRQELIRKGIVDDDVYFELIRKNKVIPYGIIGVADVISSWNEIETYKVFNKSIYTIVGSLTPENPANHASYPLYGYCEDDGGDDDGSNHRNIHTLKWRYAYLDRDHKLVHVKEITVSMTEGNNVEIAATDGDFLPRLEDRDIVRTKESNYTFKRKNVINTCSSSFMYACWYVLRSICYTIYEAYVKRYKIGEYYAREIGLTHQIYNAYKFGKIRDRSRKIEILIPILEKIRFSKQELVYILNGCEDEDTVVKMLINREDEDTVAKMLIKREEQGKKGLSIDKLDIIAKLNKDIKEIQDFVGDASCVNKWISDPLCKNNWISKIDDAHDECLCIHYDNFIQLVGFEASLETLVTATQSTLHYAIFPGIYQSSFVFGLYVFEMSYDDNTPTLGAPLAMLTWWIIFPLVLYDVYYAYRKYERQKIIDGEENFPEKFRDFLLQYMFQTYLSVLFLCVTRCGETRNPKSQFPLQCQYPRCLCSLHGKKHNSEEKQTEMSPIHKL